MFRDKQDCVRGYFLAGHDHPTTTASIILMFSLKFIECWYFCSTLIVPLYAGASQPAINRQP